MCDGSQPCWNLYTALKGPGYCNKDRQPPAARRLIFVVKGTFPGKLETGLKRIDYC